MALGASVSRAIWFTYSIMVNSFTEAGVFNGTERVKILISLGAMPWSFKLRFLESLWWRERLADESFEAEKTHSIQTARPSLGRSVPRTTHRLVGLSKTHRINLTWVPGFTGMEGNENADKMVLEGGNIAFLGLKHKYVLGIPVRHVKNNMHDWNSANKNDAGERSLGMGSHGPFRTVNYSRRQV